jgi:hypothetical protein
MCHLSTEASRAYRPSLDSGCGVSIRRFRIPASLSESDPVLRSSMPFMRPLILLRTPYQITSSHSRTQPKHATNKTKQEQDARHSPINRPRPNLLTPLTSASAPVTVPTIPIPCIIRPRCVIIESLNDSRMPNDRTNDRRPARCSRSTGRRCLASPRMRP